MEIMDASSSEVNPYIDSSVGALVWVRRRNGSWWPGRILAPEELPGAHLLSPRTGTPVKLLGREDGSVDWYNIEKSRRVKAFRCGEFDECIEKARSLASVLSRKRDKYARREDAILHALELEKEHVEQTHLQESVFPIGQNYEQLSDILNGGKLLHSDMDAINFRRSFMGLDASTDVAEASSDSLYSLREHRKFLDVEWEDDIAETLPSMRGLQDLGLGMAPLKEEKASWSSVYEQYSHASLQGDRSKAACGTIKRSVAGMALNSSGMPKKKRSAQLDLVDDDSLYKKRDWPKLMTGPMYSKAKLGDGAYDLGSKVSFSPFIMNTGRNGYVTSLHPKQEKIADLLDKVPFESKPSKGWSGSEGWDVSHFESRCRHEMFSFSSFLDKTCSSFSDHPKASCCSGPPYLYGGTPMEAASLSGSAFVDSLLQGGPASRCSFLPGASYAGSFSSEPGTEVERANSLSLLGSLSAPPISFQTWPRYSPSELISEKLMHDPGLRGQTASINPTCAPEYPFETSNASAMCSVYNNSNAISEKRRTDGGEVLLACRNHLKVVTARHCLSPVAEEDAREGSFTGEDEADSFQQIPGSSLSSLEAINVLTANDHVKQTAFFEDKSSCFKALENITSENDILNHYNPCGLKEAKTASITHGFVSTGGHLEKGCNNQALISGAVERVNSSEDHVDKVHRQFFPKWQVKGRRMARAHCRTLWGSTPVGVVDLSVEDKEEEQVASPSDVKCLGKCSRRPRHTFDLDWSSEDADNLTNTSEPTRCGCKVVADHAMRGKLPQVLEVHIRTSTYWVDVPVDVQYAIIQGEHMPFVSIMSELIGKPVVGHSVLVEKIENRNREGQIDLRSNALSRNIAGTPHLQPAWRTARRTAMQRVPRSCGIVLSLDYTQEASDKSQPRRLSNGQSRVMRKNGTQFGFSFTERRRHQKKSGLFPQKTRMLSSIAVQYGDKGTQHASLKVSDAPLVACIPVNIIFNRIREVLYGGSNNS